MTPFRCQPGGVDLCLRGPDPARVDVVEPVQAPKFSCGRGWPTRQAAVPLGTSSEMSHSITADRR